jgi:phosphoglycolate phosphatase-like HAD superfamily hydrolase
MQDVRGEAARLWLFDVDGTLVAPSDDQLHAWVGTFREVFGLDASPATITAHLGRTFAEIVGAVVRAHGQPDPSSRLPEALAAYTRHVRAVLAARPARLLPGARELLDFLKGQGDVVGVVTGNFPEEGEPKLEGMSLRGVLDLVVYADLSTPARDALLRQALNAARACGFRGDFANTVVVGDSVHDIASAHRTGALAIAVCTGLTPPDVLAASGPDLLVRDLSGLLSTLRRTGTPWVPTARRD